MSSLQFLQSLALSYFLSKTIVVLHVKIFQSASCVSLTLPVFIFTPFISLLLDSIYPLHPVRWCSQFTFSRKFSLINTLVFKNIWDLVCFSTYCCSLWYGAFMVLFNCSFGLYDIQVAFSSRIPLSSQVAFAASYMGTPLQHALLFFLLLLLFLINLGTHQAYNKCLWTNFIHTGRKLHKMT